MRPAFRLSAFECLYPIIRYCLGIMYSNFPKAKSHFSHIRIYCCCCCRCRADTFTLTISLFVDFFFPTARRWKMFVVAHICYREYAFFGKVEYAILILDLAHDSLFAACLVCLFLCSGYWSFGSVASNNKKHLELHIPLNGNANAWTSLVFPLTGMMTTTIFLFFSLSLSLHFLLTVKNQIIVVYIIIVGYVGHSLSMLASLLLLLISFFFFFLLLSVEFSLHAFTRHTNGHSESKARMMRGEAYKFITARTTKEIFFVDSIGGSNTQQEMRLNTVCLCVCVYICSQRTTKNNNEDESEASKKKKKKRKHMDSVCMHATDIWKLKGSRRHTRQ